jgi:hypothetical protein
MVQQGTANNKKKNRKPVAVQGLPAIRYNNLQQRRKGLIFLVRMRSPVQIWLAAPKNNQDLLVLVFFRCEADLNWRSQ